MSVLSNSLIDGEYLGIASQSLRQNITQQTQSSVLTLLSNGLKQLSSSLPWVASQVVNEEGIFKVKAFERTPQLLVKDLTNELPSMEEFGDAGFPFSMLDERVIAPRNTLPERFEEPAPVFLIQANFVFGGLLLVFSAQHNCMDMRGQCHVIYLFSKACCGVEFSGEEVGGGCLDSRSAIPLLDQVEMPSVSSGQGGPSVPSQEGSAIPKNTGVETDMPPKSIWSYFIFSALALSTLKSIATKTLASAYVSTDDVLSAFIWKAITLARLPRLNLTLNPTTIFDRLVDLRKHLNIPSTYIGNAVSKISTTSTIQDLVREPLGITASQLRSSITPMSDIAHQMGVEASRLRWSLQINQLNQKSNAVSQQANKTSQTSQKEGNIPAAIAAKRRNTLPPTTIKISSWAKEQCYSFDFGGLLSKAIAVRRPNFAAWEGLAYLLPKREDGEIAAALCLREEDLCRLRIDEEFERFGRFVG